MSKELLPALKAPIIELGKNSAYNVVENYDLGAGAIDIAWIFKPGIPELPTLPSAPSAADVERLLKGITYPKTKEELFEIATQKMSATSPDVLSLIDSLPERNYSDSAEVAVALGELKATQKCCHCVQIGSPQQERGKKSFEIKEDLCSRYS
jgi:Protein of unknown function (DUF2795)